MSADLVNGLRFRGVLQLLVPEHRATIFALTAGGELGAPIGQPDRPRTFFVRLIEDRPNQHTLDCVIFREGIETPIVTVWYETLSTPALWCLLGKYGLNADQRAIERLLAAPERKEGV